MITETPLNLKTETIEQLKDLQQANLNAAAALTAALNQMDHKLLKGFFERIRTVREKNAKELSQYLKVNDAEPRDATTPSGKLREFWVNLRGALNSGDPQVMLIEARRSEHSLDDAYREAILATTGSPINDVLHCQLAEVIETWKTIESFEELAA